MSDLPVCKICGYTDACLPRAGDHAEIAAMRAEVERLKAECESVARGAKLEADTNATLRAEIDTATRALREIAGDDPDDGCRQGHSKFAAQTLAEGLNRELLDSLAAEKLAREKAERERDEARAWAEKAVREIEARERLLTCAFCGHEFPPGTPPSQNAALVAHVTECPKHPMRAAEARAESLEIDLENARRERGAAQYERDALQQERDFAQTVDPDQVALAAKLKTATEALQRIEDENVCEGYCDPPQAMCANCIAAAALSGEK